jgi:hypothetical protein
MPGPKMDIHYSNPVKVKVCKFVLCFLSTVPRLNVYDKKRH